MPDSNETVAYVLREGVASSAEPQTIPGLPGRWVEGEPIAVADLGLTEEEMGRRFESLGLDAILEKTTAAPSLSSGALLSGAELRSTTVILADAVAGSPLPGLSQDEFLGRVAEERATGELSPVLEAAVLADAGLDPAESEEERMSALPRSNADLDKLAEAHYLTWGSEVTTAADKRRALVALAITPDSPPPETAPAETVYAGEHKVEVEGIDTVGTTTTTGTTTTGTSGR